MSKQPDKLDVLMDWFLGDAKEINEKQEALIRSIEASQEEIIGNLRGEVSNIVNSLPNQLNEQLSNNIKSIEALTKKIDSTISAKVRDESEQAKKDFYNLMKQELGQATGALHATTKDLSKRPIKTMALTALVCSIVAGLSSWGGAYLYNINNVESLRKEIAFYHIYQKADEAGYLAIGNQFSEKQQKKNDDVYKEAMQKKFKELIEKSDLGDFRPKEFQY